MNAVVLGSSGLIAWGLLAKVLWLSALVSIGLIVLFTVAVNALSLSRRASTVAATRALSVAVVAVASVAIGATLVWGLYFIVHK